MIFSGAFIGKESLRGHTFGHTADAAVGDPVAVALFKEAIREVDGIIGATPGGMGTAYAQMQLRQVLDAMKAYVLPFQKVLISQVHEKVDDEQLALTYEKTRQYLQRYIFDKKTYRISS